VDYALTSFEAKLYNLGPQRTEADVEQMTVLRQIGAQNRLTRPRAERKDHEISFDDAAQYAVVRTSLEHFVAEGIGVSGLKKIIETRRAKRLLEDMPIAKAKDYGTWRS
jgi:hypothetical protein